MLPSDSLCVYPSGHLIWAIGRTVTQRGPECHERSRAAECATGKCQRVQGSECLRICMTSLRQGATSVQQPMPTDLHEALRDLQ